MQLLDIKITPIEYEIHIEQGKLVPADSVEADSSQNYSQSTQNRSAGNKFVRMDTLAVKTSPQNSVQSMTLVEPVNPANNTYAVYNDNNDTTDTKSSETGVNMNIQFIDKKMATIASQMNLSPEFKIDPSWEPVSGVSNSDFSDSVSADFFNIERSKIEYVPGRFHMDIIQYPKVEIEYIGGFNYVPKSSDPNYEGEE